MRTVKNEPRGDVWNVRVDVTKNCIRDGIISDCRFCPVAIAIGVATGMVAKASGRGLILLDGQVEKWIAETPVLVSDFIYRFDNGDSVRPITFTATFTRIKR